MIEMDEAYGGINVVQVQVDSGMTNRLNNPYFLQYLIRCIRWRASRG